MHDVAISGYGEENGERYWIGRNSWGSYWGDRGWFKIQRGSNTLGIELACSWGVPEVPNLSQLDWMNGAFKYTKPKAAAPQEEGAAAREE